MSTLSVPLTPKLEEFIKAQVKSGRAANKADVVRRALVLLSEEEAVATVLQGRKEVREGKILRGDLRELAKKFK
ncbi:MAG: type II toxin-antitoxin system ParD family antitoxin [Patescibacteria group bacterium]